MGIIHFAEGYFLPRETPAQVKRFLPAEQPVVLDAPAKVSLFLLDSGVAAVRSFLEHSTRVRLLFAKPVRVTDVLTGQTLRGHPEGKATVFEFSLAAGEFRALKFRPAGK